MIRSYLYLSRAKVESIVAQVESRRARLSKLDLKVAAVELGEDSPDKPERLLSRAEHELAVDGLVKELDTAGPAEYFYGTMQMRWGRVDCDWGDVGPEPTVMFIGRSAGTQVALYGSLQHVRGYEDVEGSTTGSYGFVLWNLVADRLNATEPGLVDREYRGIAAGRDHLDRWSEEEQERETHATLGIVHDRLRNDGYFEFFAIVHKRFDCTRAIDYREPARWVLGSPLYVAWATPPAPLELPEAASHVDGPTRAMTTQALPPT